MLEEFVNGFALFASYSPAVAVIAANALILVFFVLFLFLKNKRPFFYFGGAFTSLECAFLYFADSPDAAVLLTAVDLSLVCLLTGVLRCFSERAVKDDAPVREFVRSLDKKLKTPVPADTMREESALAAPKFSSEADVKKSLSISHAHSVIERLSYFDLSVSDRNKINELEFALAGMEKEDVPLSAVNEKLSCLIRMLAKYGA